MSRTIQDSLDQEAARQRAGLAHQVECSTFTNCQSIPAMPKRRLSMLSSDERKKYPVATGFIDYFPDAMAEVAHVSWRGNQKHNPGQPLHWARGKSSDHADCQARHMIERGTLDPEGIEHMAQKAWRAMAELQEYLEQKYGLDLPRGATAPGQELPTKEQLQAAKSKL